MLANNMTKASDFSDLWGKQLVQSTTAGSWVGKNIFPSEKLFLFFYVNYYILIKLRDVIII